MYKIARVIGCTRRSLEAIDVHGKEVWRLWCSPVKNVKI